MILEYLIIDTAAPDTPLAGVYGETEWSSHAEALDALGDMAEQGLLTAGTVYALHMRAAEPAQAGQQ